MVPIWLKRLSVNYHVATSRENLSYGGWFCTETRVRSRRT